MDKRIERIVEWIEGYAENAGRRLWLWGFLGVWTVR